MSYQTIDVKKINEILEKTIYSIENSKEEIVNIVEQARTNLKLTEKELEEIKEKVEKTIKEVDELEIKEKKSRLMLSNVSKNFHIYTQEELKEAYDIANSVRIQLFLKREEEKNLIKRRKELEIRLKSEREVLNKAEKAWKSVSVVTEYLKGNLDEIMFTVDHLNKKQTLGIKIIEAQEEEKQRLARDIHDGPAQSMANILIKAEICERLIDIDKEKFRNEMKNLKEIVRMTLRDIRKTIYDLRPMSLDDLGLIPTLERYVQKFNEYTGINIELKVFGQTVTLNSSIQIAIFRIIQEALSNISKHSKATEGKIIIEFSQNRVNVTIIDNGIGFEYDKSCKDELSIRGYGLMNMKERVELLGGKINIKSAPLEGTRISFYIMLPDKEE
ncbi:MAG: sensor histidine kinase [Tissierellia bacterium]|nr:sensor histidine kinase [Tissierellia bacterium]